MSWWTKYTEVEVELAIANALAGGGPGTPSAPDTSVQFNDGGAFGGDATITIEGAPKALVVANTGSAFGSLAIANNDQSFPFWDSGTGLSVLQNAADPTFDYNTFLAYTVVDADKTISSSMSELRLSQNYNYASGFLEANVSAIGDAGFDSISHAIITYYSVITLDGTATTDFVAAFYAGSFISTHPLSAPLASFYSEPTVNFGASASAVYGAYLKAPTLTGGGGGTVTLYNGVWQEATGGRATNAYSFWHDEQGVFRIRADNTFDSVYQAIASLYNPQYPKYTPGAQAFERLILGQFNGNVVEIGTEKGPTQTLTSVTSVGTTATATKTNHGYRTGDMVTIAGADQVEYNGAYSVTRLTANTFSYTFAGSATTPATGTITSQAGTLRKLRLIGAGLLLDSTILPTSNPGAGQLWNDGNTVKVGT